MSFHQLLKTVKSSEQDFEFYPTSSRMIEVVINRLNALAFKEKYDSKVLDIGAGDGRVLKAFQSNFHSKVFAIEKSQPLLNLLSTDIAILGTDFNEVDLTDKAVDVIFCNPPYSEYAEWFSKIVNTAYAKVAYMVVPERWKDNDEIQFALKSRKAKATVLSSDDFLDGDRKARAKVDIVEIAFADLSYWHSSRNSDPFDFMFNRFFPNIKDAAQAEKEMIEAQETYIKNKTNEIRVLKSEFDLSQLVLDYQQDLEKLQTNYRAILSLDPILLKEMGVNVETIKNGLKEKLVGLKNRYWKIFFNVYNVIYDYCTFSSTNKIQEKLAENRLDFTLSNLYAITQLILRYASEQKDEQLTDFFLKLADLENIKLYKSNQRVFSGMDWRYSRTTENYRRNQEKLPSHYQLEYRIITREFGSLGGYYSENMAVFNKIRDVFVIAQTLNLNVLSTRQEVTLETIENFTYGERFPLHFINKDGQREILAELKFYRNGNVHFFFNQEFAVRLNVEAGRLLGWVKSASEASEDMGYPLEKVMEAFGVSANVLSNSLKALPSKLNNN